jgi:mannose-6-phosphate isomerase-like protein (cupin superfamily)
MTRKVSTANAIHYTWGESCDGWHLLQSSRLSIIEEEMPCRTSEVRHFHRNAQQFFYVLGGEAEMEIEGVCVSLSHGEGIWVPPGAEHQIRNQSGVPVRFLVVSEPPSQGDRVACNSTINGER